MAEQEGITVKKSEDFSEWYTQVVQKADLADYGITQGTIAFKPTAYAIWEKIQSTFDEKIKKTGHKNAYFPLLIPESLLRKEAEHFEGFVPECFFVTHSGDNKLGERLAVRPTSETIIYTFYSKWVRSWRDLPLLLNQWCNILRAEIKSTKPFIRTSEFLWQEGHTAHETKEDADREVMYILKEYQDVIENYLAVPVLVGKKSELEKFAGALYTTTLESMMPDGKALQVGTSHNLGQNFSRPFEIKFLDRNGKEQYVWTTSWGISTRLIGGLIMVHGDDKGLVLPPKVAPTQIVIVPIYYKTNEKKIVLKRAEDIKSELEESGFTVFIDGREGYTPGWKFNEWEMKGIPLRMEIGPRDIKNKQVVAVRRDNNEKTVVKENETVEKVSTLLDSIQKNLFEKAKGNLKKSIADIKSYEEFKKVVVSKGGFVRTSWCGENHCEEQVKNETSATIRLIPFKREGKISKCIYCNKPGKEVVYFARAY